MLLDMVVIDFKSWLANNANGIALAAFPTTHTALLSL